MENLSAWFGPSVKKQQSFVFPDKSMTMVASNPSSFFSCQLAGANLVDGVLKLLDQPTRFINSTLNFTGTDVVEISSLAEMITNSSASHLPPPLPHFLIHKSAKL